MLPGTTPHGTHLHTSPCLGLLWGWGESKTVGTRNGGHASEDGNLASEMKIEHCLPVVSRVVTAPSVAVTETQPCEVDGGEVRVEFQDNSDVSSRRSTSKTRALLITRTVGLSVCREVH